LSDTGKFLTHIPTQWSAVFLAGQSDSGPAAAARRELLVRYHEAVFRYLARELRDDNAAGKLYSDFAVRVLEVDPFLKRADPGRGRFRDYLRAVLRRMVVDHYRGQQRQNKKVRALDPDGADEPAAQDTSPVPEEEERFLSCWRQELINQVWRALEQAEQKTKQPYATLLKHKEHQPGLHAPQLAELLTAELGRPFTAAGVRKLVQRGRELFGELLVQEVARSLRSSPGEKVPAAQVEQELIELGVLFSYCKAALERYAADQASTS
jgi:RNA polymerase sigma-70 factor (ECF subfamily)